MTIQEYIHNLKNNPAFMDNATSWQVLPAREARYGQFPEGLDPRITLKAACGSVDSLQR